MRDYGNQISIFAFGAKSWGISFSNQIHYGEEERELHEFYILEQWPRAMECYQKFSQPKIFTQNQSSIIMRQTTHNIDCVCARIRVGLLEPSLMFQAFIVKLWCEITIIILVCLPKSWFKRNLLLVLDANPCEYLFCPKWILSRKKKLKNWGKCPKIDSRYVPFFQLIE